MRTAASILVLSVASTVQAGVLSTLNGSFNSPTYTSGTYLSSYKELYWTGGDGNSPKITSDGQLDLYSNADVKGLAEFSLPAASGSFTMPQSSGQDLCIAFTLNFKSSASTGNVYNVIAVDIGGYYVFVTATKKTGTTISLSLGGQGSNANANTIIISDTGSIRLLLAVTKAVTSGTTSTRTAYLSDASTLTTGNYSADSIKRTGIKSAIPDDLMIWTTPDFGVTMDDLIVGNSLSDVTVPLTTAPVPEPATLLLSLPVAALLLRRKRVG